MSLFDQTASQMLTKMGVKDTTPKGQHKAQPAKQQKAEVVKESVTPPKPRKQVVLVSSQDVLTDDKEITLESLQKVGFQSANKEDFIGASDKTVFMDVSNSTGRATVVYDFMPLGNQGKPALHLYYSANENPISESLVCFSAAGTIGDIREVISIMQKIKPTETRSIHTLKTISESIEQAKKSIIT